jgi:hypothetical protein
LDFADFFRKLENNIGKKLPKSQQIGAFADIFLGEEVVKQPSLAVKVLAQRIAQVLLVKTRY